MGELLMQREIVIEAIKGSIRKWESIAAGIGIDAGSSNCALCKLSDEYDYECNDCPVGYIMLDSGCSNNEYHNYNIHMKLEHSGGLHYIYSMAFCPECRRLATLEVDYLKRVLEKYKDGDYDE